VYLSASKGEHEISVGNVVGDNVIKATLVLGLVSFVQPIQVSVGEILSTIPFTILFTGGVFDARYGMGGDEGNGSAPSCRDWHYPGSAASSPELIH